jgi:hypothetical protein
VLLALCTAAWLTTRRCDRSLPASRTTGDHPFRPLRKPTARTGTGERRARNEAIALRTCVTINPFRVIKFRGADSNTELSISLLARKETSCRPLSKGLLASQKVTGQMTEDGQWVKERKELYCRCDTRKSVSTQSSSMMTSHSLSRSIRTAGRRNELTPGGLPQNDFVAARSH